MSFVDPSFDEILFLKARSWVLRRFFNPTRGWPPRRVQRLEFTPAEASLNGIPLGAPIDAAEALGPVDDLTPRVVGPSFVYDELGLVVGCRDGKIRDFRVIMDPASREQWVRRVRPGVLTVRMPDGSSHRVSRDTSEHTLFALFGAPTYSGTMADDWSYTFRVGPQEFHTFHDPGSHALVEIWAV
jgi:hypothetical protein